MNQFDTQDIYFKTCDSLSENGYDVRLYQSAELATYDVVQSLIHFMPHKNKIAVANIGSHLVETVTSLALKNQNQIIYKKPNENTLAFLETLDSSVHFFYWASENEITGEILYNEKQCEEILSVLNRKKIFSIQIASRLPSKMPFATDASSTSVIVLVPSVFRRHQEATAVYFSDKQKIPFGIATLQNPLFLKLPIPSVQQPPAVVIPIEDVSALAIKEYMKLSDNQAFVSSDFPSWVTDKWVNWWPEAADASTLNSLLILSGDYVTANKDYLKSISHATEQIKALSHWKL